MLAVDAAAEPIMEPLEFGVDAESLARAKLLAALQQTGPTSYQRQRIFINDQ